MGLSNFTEETDVTKTSITLTLSGADYLYFNLLNENVVNDSVKILEFLDDSNAHIRPFLLYSGSIDTFAVMRRNRKYSFFTNSFTLGRLRQNKWP